MIVFRRLLKAPAFSLTVIATLAVGIACNTVVFTLVSHLMIRPLPFAEPSELVEISEQHTAPLRLTGATLQDLRSRATSFESLAAYREFPRNIGDARESPPEQIDAASVSAEFFRTFKTELLLGRPFEQEDFSTNGEKKIILSYRLWRRSFGSDPGIVGRRIVFQGEPTLVAGVASASFRFPEQADAWYPMALADSFQQNRRAHLFSVVARLKKGISPIKANSELMAIAAAVDRDSGEVDSGLQLHATGLQSSLAAPAVKNVLILLAAVAFVLLIACVNATNLLLTRLLGASKELSIRAALGASKTRLVLDLTAEATVLVAAAMAIGTAVAWVCVRTVVDSFPQTIPGVDRISIDWRVWAFTAATSSVCVCLAVLAPAFHVLREDPLSGLKGATPFHHKQHSRRVLVVAEVALAMVLLVSAGLLIRSFQRVQAVDPGFDRNVAVVPLPLTGERYATPSDRVRFIENATQELRSISGIAQVGATGSLPLRPAPVTTFDLSQAEGADAQATASVSTVTPEYFSTMKMAVIAGRGIAATDREGAPVVAVVNRAMVRRYYGTTNPIGRFLVMQDWGEPLRAEIVGIVGDVVNDSLDTEPMPTVYFSLPQFREATLVLYLVFRAEASLPGVADAVQQRIWRLDPQLPVRLTTMESLAQESVNRRRFILWLLAAFATIAMVLAMTGVYSVLSYSTSQRAHEFAVRLAVGAQRTHLLNIVFSEAMVTALAGIGIGAMGALMATKGLTSLLFGISPFDPTAFLGISILVLVVCGVGALIPALRASQTEPLKALKSE
jgi:putative ABC transport system permease protein